MTIRKNTLSANDDWAYKVYKTFLKCAREIKYLVSIQMSEKSRYKDNYIMRMLKDKNRIIFFINKSMIFLRKIEVVEVVTHGIM